MGETWFIVPSEVSGEARMSTGTCPVGALGFHMGLGGGGMSVVQSTVPPGTDSIICKVTHLHI